MKRSCQGSRTWLPEGIVSIGVGELGRRKQRAEGEDSLALRMTKRKVDRSAVR